MSEVSNMSERKMRSAFRNVFRLPRVEKCGQMTNMAKLIAYPFTTSRR
jgi:hypothetical protein